MAKRRIYNGVYKTSYSPRRRVNTSNQDHDEPLFIRNCLKYLWMFYSTVIDNCVSVVTFAVVIVLIFLLPVTNTHKTNELNEMKKVLDLMTEEVTRAEVACLVAAEDLCSLRCSIRDEETETTKEVRDLSISTSPGLLSKRSEPVQVEKKISFFRRILSLHRDISRKEIAIMSIMYTDSFDS
ncbi:uncharacterized protein LOC125065962 isoform X1 [Vanessa atalanta]|uniref:uncharacterized protein LOC125065962 isoform X1 n=1 Tax=Vanessa atalanta TaxID=42275 RepID=UPI001FCDB976|nr:uncharacterized protein LOC125065962 isoform X1 [Vanessa atalanta]